MAEETIPCSKAIEVYNKLKQEFTDIYPTGGLLLCLAGVINETRDVDIVSKVHDRMTRLVRDNTIVHIFPFNNEIHSECYQYDNYVAIYYCIKYKLYKLSLSSPLRRSQ